MSAQRISDWRAGRNVPARFESLLPVVLALGQIARESGRSLPAGLADAREWQRVWSAATDWTPAESDGGECPYPGLTAFREQDRELFFGRVDAAGRLAEAIRAAARESTGVVLLIGASGAGKSSLLAAGLVPAVHNWSVRTIVPGAQPGAALDALTDLTRDSLIIVDQFEELFTVCPDEREREQFLAVLHGYATDPGKPAVIVAVRADFYAHCLAHPVLRDAVEHRSHVLGPMHPDELAHTITGPARHVGLTLEPGLEELVLTELCGIGGTEHAGNYDPGALPLLSHVMAATWQHREGRKLTIAGYRKAGGVLGSVAATAELAWDELSEAQRAAAKDVLLGLVAVGRDSRDTRRTVTRPELLTRTADSVAAATALDVLARTRLVTVDSGSVHLTHEIVLGAWPRLRDWIEDDRVGFLVRQRLEADASEWDSTGRDPSLLYRGQRLGTARDNTNPPALAGITGAFLDESQRLTTHSRRRSTRTKVVLALLGVALLVAGVTAYTQTRFGAQQREARDLAAVLAEADRLQQADPALAAQLYMVAERMRPGDPDVRARLLATQNTPLATVLDGSTAAMLDLAFQPGGRLLAAATADKTVRLWNLSEPGKPRAAGRLDSFTTAPRAIAFSADGRLLAVGSADALQLWDVSDAAGPRQLTPPVTAQPNVHFRMAFTPDSRTLITLSILPTRDRLGMVLWDLSDPAKPAPGRVLPVPAGSTTDFVLSADGSRAAISTSVAHQDTIGNVELWDTSDPRNPIRVGPPIRTEHDIQSVAFSPDGRTLAVAGMGDASTYGYGGIVDLWNISDATRPERLGTPIIDSDAPIHAVEFGPDGRTLATSGRTGTKLWSVADPGRPTSIGETLSGSPVKCTSELSCTREPTLLAFGADGRTLATGGAEGSVRLWSLSAATLGGYVGWGEYPEFDASGERAALDSADGRVLVWDTRDPLDPRLLTEVRSAPGWHAIDLSPDGRSLAVRDFYSDTTKVFDLSGPAPSGALTQWPGGMGGSVGPYAFSADWRRLVTGYTVPTGVEMQMWDVTDRRAPKTLGGRTFAGKFVVNGAFNRNGTLFALVTLSDETSNRFGVTLWDVRDPARPVRVGPPLDLPRTKVEASPSIPMAEPC
ncbi:nSTAND1 domain-containing NTPase [Nocardia sp. NPDC055321]